MSALLSDLPAPAHGGALQRRSRCLFHWMGSACSTVAETGHVGTFVGDGGTLVDSHGAAITAATYQPRFEPRTLSSGPAMGLRMGTSDRLTFTTPGASQMHIPWQPMAGLHRIVEDGGVGIGDGTLFSITNTDADAPLLALFAGDSTTYALVYNNGTDEVEVALAVAPDDDDEVDLWWHLFADGSIRLWQTINGSLTATAQSGAPTGGLVVMPAVDTCIVINALGAISNGAAWHRQHKLVAGTPTSARLFALY